MKITFKNLGVDNEKKYAAVAEEVRIAKQDFINCVPEETEAKRKALQDKWNEFAGATIEKIDGVDVKDLNKVDIGEAVVSFFEKVLILPK